MHEIFERLASDTWERLRDAKKLQVIFGEETITDLLLLEMKRLAPRRLHIIQTPKHKEKLQGTDWEWWIENDSGVWVRYAIQAKKLKGLKQTYATLTHKVGGIPQVDLLKKYAITNGAIPLYVLYNHVSQTIDCNTWHCCEHIDGHQLGCSIATIASIEAAINGWGTKSFTFLHAFPDTLPWRCLFKCRKNDLMKSHGLPTQIVEGEGVAPDASISSYLYSDLPAEIVRSVAEGQLTQFPTRLYDPDLRYFPERIAVISRQQLESHRNGS